MVEAPTDPIAGPIIKQLRSAAEKMKDPRYEKAAELLEAPASKLGRKAIDDKAALHKMRQLLSEGKAKSRWEAAEQVAADLGGHSVESTAKRLNRKFRALPAATTANATTNGRPSPPLSAFELECLFQQVRPFLGTHPTLGATGYRVSLLESMIPQKDREEMISAQQRLRLAVDEMERQMDAAGLRKTLELITGKSSASAWLAKFVSDYERDSRIAKLASGFGEPFKLADIMKSQV